MLTVYDLSDKLESLGWEVELNSGGFQYAEKYIEHLKVIIGFNETTMWVDTAIAKGRVPTPVTPELIEALSLIQEWKDKRNA